MLLLLMLMGIQYKIAEDVRAHQNITRKNITSGTYKQDFSLKLERVGQMFSKSTCLSFSALPKVVHLS